MGKICIQHPFMLVVIDSYNGREAHAPKFIGSFNKWRSMPTKYSLSFLLLMLNLKVQSGFSFPRLFPPFQTQNSVKIPLDDDLFFFLSSRQGCKGGAINAA